jgi:hypothetical protein
MDKKIINAVLVAGAVSVVFVESNPGKFVAVKMLDDNPHTHTEIPVDMVGTHDVAPIVGTTTVAVGVVQNIPGAYYEIRTWPEQQE